MNSYYIVKDRIYFKTGYNPNFIRDVKNIAGRKYDMDTRMWDCPIDIYSFEQIGHLLKEYDIAKDAVQNGMSFEDILGGYSLEHVLEQKLDHCFTALSSLNLPCEPWDCQINGIVFMLTTKRCINGSDMGTGKTATTILAVEVEDLFPCLVIVPMSVKYNWKKQWLWLNPNRTVSVIENEKSDFSKDVLITTYDSIGSTEKYTIDGEEKERVILKYSRLAKIGFKSIVMDECQYVKSSKTIRSKALKKLVKRIDYRFMLTGTVILNRPEELINPLTILGHFDRLFGGWKDFVYNYCGATETRFGIDTSGATNTLELNDKLRRTCYYRVEKRDVLKDLPERLETVLEMTLDNRKEYEFAEKDLIAYLKRNFDLLKVNSALMAEQLVRLNVLIGLAAKGKIEGIKNWLDIFVESSTEKIVVFGIHIDPLTILAHHYKCDLITGDVSSKKRQDIIDDFQSNDKRVLFMNILTGSVGIDGLQHVCSNMLIYEIPWRPTDIEQAVSRLERSGQKNTINVYYMLAQDSIDMKMWEMVMAKKNITDAVNKGEDVDTQKYLMKMLKSFL